MDNLETKCSVSNKEFKVDGIGTGYAVDKDSNKICYDCCSEKDKRYMEEHSKIDLYLTKKVTEKGMLKGAVSYEVVNWPGTLRFRTQFKRGKHNMTGSRIDVWFRDHLNNKWWGVNYGEWTEIVHCTKLKNSK